MNNMKLYQKQLIALLVVLLSPLIIIYLIPAGICALVQMPKNMKEYKKPRYYLVFRQRFMMNSLYEDTILTAFFPFCSISIQHIFLGQSGSVTNHSIPELHLVNYKANFDMYNAS